MFDRLRAVVLHYLRVPLAPAAPAGAPGSLRTFRAGRNYYRLRLARWFLTQLAALVGILVSVAFFHYLRNESERIRNLPVASANPEPAPTGEPPAAERKAKRKSSPKDFERVAAHVARQVPVWALPALAAFEILVLIGFLLSLPVSYSLVRLDYELRWYLVTDRSLRIRQGIWGLHEMTMSFANLQQVVVTQGPLQRLLGIANVRVQSAGGGGQEEGASHESSDSLHTAVFHGVENASEIRDLILERLRLFREAGLGDPDDTSVSLAPTGASLQQAASRLLEETRALRAAWPRADTHV
ncbi:MAG: PH domain-containing protein [Opitutaceae bacterium]|nr:PH domain-containing protein [Opitutaceae bacterium]